MLAETEQLHELTPTQEAMLIFSLYAPKSQAYFEQVCYEYTGALDIDAFGRAWQRVVDRHEILRTSFVADDGERFRAQVHTNAKVDLAKLDLRDLTDAEKIARRDSFLLEDTERGFDLAKAPLIRVAVLQADAARFWIIVSNHHIILDGWSMSRIRREVSDFYKAELFGRELNLPQPPGFAPYLEWLSPQGTTGPEDFWRRELAEFTAPNKLAIDAGVDQATLAAGSFAEQTLFVSSELSDQLRARAKNEHVTLSTIVQAAWAVLLSRYCSNDDVVFGITVAGRPYDLPEVESIVGLLINTLPLRARVDAHQTVSGFLKDVQRRVSGALDYEACPLKQIQKWTTVPFNLSLFDTLLVFENFAGSGSLYELGGTMEISSAQLSRTNYPLTLVVHPGEQTRLQIVYHANRFSGPTVERMLLHLQEILKGIARDGNATLASLRMLTAPEEKQLLVDFNETSKQFPVTKNVICMFERQVEAAPKAIAVVDQGTTITYRGLNARANQLARHLRSLGIEREQLVGICVPRSVEMIVAVLAVLKAGGAYVPLDPTYPTDRLIFMLEDSGANVIVTQDALRERLTGFAGTVVCVDQAADQPAVLSSRNLSQTPAPEDAAYVIYTSGSTGKPKGTLIEHRSLLNFAQAAIEMYAIRASDRVLQFASLSFDTSVEEIMPALASGASLILRTDEMLSSAPHFLRACETLEVTVLDLPTAYWHELTDELAASELSVPECIRLVILGGEKALPERVRAWFKRAGNRVQLVNSYGPTEATIVTTICDLTAAEVAEAPIGRPIANALAYVLDSNLQPVPVGLPGELYIGGLGVARGYINRPELTAEKFINNPFNDPRAPRLYRTGDLVRYREDANLEFLGRIDHQVKVRGFRIELEEIEAAIRAHRQVVDAVVLAVDDRLAGYVVCDAGAQLSGGDLRRFLLEKLPGYMIPSTFLFLESLPLMPNGKTDRRALLLLEQPANQLSEDAVAPRSPLEQSIAEVWTSVLRIERPGIHDNFFELGGHSLMAAKLISNLRRQLGVELSLIDIFQSPTIAKLSALIYERQTESEADDDLAALLDELENMSDEEAQQRLEQEISKGGVRAHALKLALIATGTLQFLAEAL